MSCSDSGRSAYPEDVGSAADQVRELHVKRGEAWVRNEVETYLSFYWEDAVLFTVDERISWPQLQERLHSLLKGGGGALMIDLPPADDIVISSQCDAATTIFAWRARSRSIDGAVSERSYFETDVWYRRNGMWKIIRMHLTRLSLTPVLPPSPASSPHG
jgi:ketosteroid isomerase-like protein